ncbi:anthocyanidin 3-O-glucosyltransferase 2-like [Olea europaea subsp. europaea]|uniref:Anthocyanidin 3-O-glucosyltransferase 2-like n=1 Tax=Olea europaea subsp. europaea TaxID=158383 RepID=A0A8S0RPB8_OLEEU|nr:anthocyanidin 3-O-glucosyltransferase 2-like [Olea europaea subsp. europaea]
MAEIKNAELVFIPIPGMGYFVPTIEMAKLLTDRDERLSITKFLNHHPIAPNKFVFHFVESHKDLVRDAVAKMVRDESIRLAGFVIDMFCTTMIDIANEFGVSSYVFNTTSAARLGLNFHMQSLSDEQNLDVSEYKNSDAELLVPTYINPVPGFLINTFLDLEAYALKSLSDDDKIPPVYPIGPILHVKAKNDDNKDSEEIMEFLDEQPVSSVVFLCFGSMGYFDGDQIKEIAIALEQCGHRFLWSLRKPHPKDSLEDPSEYENPEEVSPKGFLQRTAGFEKVIGWAPQVAILSHPSVGGFVSHCGWNSTLESVWCGVPIAAWSMYAEQHTNAFELVKDLGNCCGD